MIDQHSVTDGLEQKTSLSVESGFCNQVYQFTDNLKF